MPEINHYNKSIDDAVKSSPIKKELKRENVFYLNNLIESIRQNYDKYAEHHKQEDLEGANLKASILLVQYCSYRQQGYDLSLITESIRQQIGSYVLRWYG